MIGIIKLDERKIIIQSIIKILKENKLSDTHKKYFYEIVLNTKKTKQQKERFNMYYGLGEHTNNAKTILEISKYYNCTVSAIRCAIIAVEHALYRISEDTIRELNEILQNYKY